ncbi:MFS transporter [Macrococcoides caseolyticum]|uniref:MFS transporter n=1 Tax=Macrococcoides caseolyticum TaxID=69966 RepID=UPI001F435DDB|nr:MFS transporter [Macrococcus caseolyticus]MCE4957456.1 MFS transporter [Macrococcus caseolyticus]
MFKKNFIILTIIVSISGLTQGMLLPLIAIIFERENVPSFINGLHASSLYIGVFLASLFLEGLLRKVGYKHLVIIGAIIIVLSMAMFPVIKNMTFWFALRLLVGVGDNMLHFSTQSWLTETTPKHKLGRIISLYGLSFSLGFMAGPLLAKLHDIHESLPFIMSAIFTLLASGLVLLLKNEFPEDNATKISFRTTTINFGKVMKTSWVAFLFPMMYGVLEACLNSNFPVFAMKQGIEVDIIVLIIPAFSLGAILFQIPLGMLSDNMNRNLLLVFVTCIGACLFLMCQLFSHEGIVLIVLFFITGIFIGSLYSLGVTFMTEITPKALLPAGNLMCGLIFSIGSIIGPILGGLVIQFSNNTQFFSYMSFILFLISFATFYDYQKRKKIQQTVS